MKERSSVEKKSQVPEEGEGVRSGAQMEELALGRKGTCGPLRQTEGKERRFHMPMGKLTGRCWPGLVTPPLASVILGSGGEVVHPRDIEQGGE